MSNNEIKKKLYKQNPDARMSRVTKDDIHDAKFLTTMQAKLLIRWLV